MLQNKTLDLNAAGSGSVKLVHILYRISLFLLPLAAIFGPAIGKGPLFLFRILVPVICVSAFFICKPRKVSTVLHLGLIFSFLLASSFSLLVSKYPRHYGELVTIGLAIGLSWGLSGAAKKDWILFFRGWILALWVSISVAVWEIITKNHLPWYRNGAWRTNLNELNAPGATFTNPNMFGFFLAISVAVCAILAVTEKKALQLFNLVSAVIAISLIFATGSELALFGVILFGFTVGWLIKRTRLITSLIFIFSVGLALGLSTTGILDIPIAKYMQMVETTFVDKELAIYNSFGIRLALLVNGLHLTNKYFFTGVGPGAFEETANSQEWLVETKGIVNPHNGIIELSAQYGAIVAIVIILGALTFSTRLCINSFKVNEMKTGQQPNQYICLCLAGLWISMISLVGCNSIFIDQSIAVCTLAFLTAASLNQLYPVTNATKNTIPTKI